jgi:hypothetical protein
MAARLSALRAGRILPPGFFIFKDSWYSLLLEAESTPGGKGQYERKNCAPLPPGSKRQHVTRPSSAGKDMNRIEFNDRNFLPLPLAAELSERRG